MNVQQIKKLAAIGSYKPSSTRIVDPRRLQILKAFDEADERKKELMFRQAVCMRCQKVSD